MANPTADRKNISDRLRETAKGGLPADEYRNVVADRDLLFEAAVAIDVKQAEIERLREVFEEACREVRVSHDIPCYCKYCHEDPTPWCTGCGAMKEADCHCGPIAKND